MQTALRCALPALFLLGCLAPARAEELVAPTSIQKVVADGKHNAFTALVKWKDSYWLAFRKADSHAYGEADLHVLRSSDGQNWEPAHVMNVLPDDRDPQFLVTPKRLYLYDPALKGRDLTSFVSYTDDGSTWSEPQAVYEPRFIFWKPIEHEGQFWATAHRKAEGSEGGTVREVHLIRSKDALNWEKVSTIRAGNWESETTIWFAPNNQLTAFLRQKYSTPGFILEAQAPYREWKQRPAGVHLSGHAVYDFDGTTYVFSRLIEGKATGTRIYTYDGQQLTPYCDLPSGGDCSYPAAVKIGQELLVSYYSSHEGSTNVYLAKVPLK